MKAAASSSRSSLEMKPARRAAAEVAKTVQGRHILGLVAQSSDQLPTVPEGPAVACRVKLKGGEASVQVLSSDPAARSWVPFGKFNLSLARGQDKFDAIRFVDGLAEGVLNRLVRAQVIKGATTRENGKLVYQIRIENASPLVLNGLALLGTGSPEEEKPKVLTGICVSPRQKPHDSGERASRQGTRPQEGYQADGTRPERALIPAQLEQRPPQALRLLSRRMIRSVCLGLVD